MSNQLHAKLNSITFSADCVTYYLNGLNLVSIDPP